MKNKTAHAYVGARYGFLTVIKISRRNNGRLFCLCACECGNKRDVWEYDLRREHTKSCGCFRESQVLKANTTHGKTGTPTFKSWQNMRVRCLNKTRDCYEDYGGRGITICERWDSFNNFLSDMGERPAGKSLDRIDNDGPYSKRNCRWATAEQQAQNSRAAKVSVAEVLKIRELYSSGKYSFAKLGNMFDITDSSAWNIVSFKTWKNV